jgi:hypothetical protein
LVMRPATFGRSSCAGKRLSSSEFRVPSGSTFLVSDGLEDQPSQSADAGSNPKDGLSVRADYGGFPFPVKHLQLGVEVVGEAARGAVPGYRSTVREAIGSRSV